MPHYLVLKRTVHDWTSLPGEILVDPDAREAGILMERGFITPVPDNYPGTISTPPEPPVVESASTAVEDLKDLMSNSRAKLNELAMAAGIEAPEAFENKRLLAEAILVKEAESGGTES